VVFREDIRAALFFQRAVLGVRGKPRGTLHAQQAADLIGQRATVITALLSLAAAIALS
jgi:hypothetical protein